MQYLLRQYFQSVTVNFTTRAPHLTQKASAVVTFVLSRVFRRRGALAGALARRLEFTVAKAGLGVAAGAELAGCHYEC
jgi:hypothetical protein